MGRVNGIFKAEQEAGADLSFKRGEGAGCLGGRKEGLGVGTVLVMGVLGRRKEGSRGREGGRKGKGGRIL